MALRTKLYIAFVFMVMLSVGVALISISAFRSAGQGIDKTREMADYVASELIPVNACWADIETQVQSAGLFYYSYAFSFLPVDFELGNKQMAEAEKQFESLTAILTVANPDRLPATRAALAECRKNAKEMAAIGTRIHDADLEVKKLDTQYGENADALSAIADERYIDAYASLKELMTVESEAGEAERRAEKLELLSDVFDSVNWGNQTFWQARNHRGVAAQKFYRQTQEHLTKLMAAVDEYNTTEKVPDSAQRRQFTDIRDRAQRMHDISIRIESLYMGIDEMTGQLEKLSDVTTSKVREVAQTASAQVVASAKQIQDATNNIDSMVTQSERLQYGALIVALIIGLVLATIITRGIVRPIDYAISQLTRGEETISNAADNIATASQNLAEGASEQAASVEETSSALEEIDSMSKLSSENAQRTSGQTRETIGLIQGGSDAMRDMSGAMTEINERSEKVQNIIKTIEDIAFQTNLLALNAAVEAARAGEAGKGFAVVADEVRNLSQRSAAAARDTTELINGTVESIRRGSHITNSLTESYRGIETGTSGIGNLIEQIANAAHEQSEGIQQVNNALAQMDKVTQQNAASSEETASASSELMDQLAELRTTVQQLTSLIHGRGADNVGFVRGNGKAKASNPPAAPFRPAEAAPPFPLRLRNAARR